MSGIPIYNVNNNCSTGSTGLLLGKQLIETGNNDCILVVGFEKMERGSLGAKYTDRTIVLDKQLAIMAEDRGMTEAPLMPQMFGNAGLEHMERYGSKPEHFAKIAYKNHKHSTNNPYAQFQDEYTLDQVLKSPRIHEYLTKLQCSPTSDGSAAVILASEHFVRRHGLEAQAVEIVGLEMATDLPSTITDRSMMTIVGYDMSKLAAQKVFSKTNYKPTDVDVVELHDCFSANELITYEALGLCPEGKAHELVDRGDNTYGGKYVINPSGGLISKGHPLGATGLAQCSELCWQLRGQADKRQVKNARLGLQHNIGLGGAAVVGLYRLGFPQHSRVALNLTAAPADNRSPDGEGFQVTPYLRVLEQAMAEDKEGLIEKVRGVYGFKVSGGPNGQTGYWVIDAKQGSGKVEYNGTAKPDVTFIVNDADVTDLISGKLAPQKAFFPGQGQNSGQHGTGNEAGGFAEECSCTH